MKMSLDYSRWFFFFHTQIDGFGAYVKNLFATERQQGDSADNRAGEHVHQGRPSQEGELQSQDGPAQQEEQEERRTGQVHNENNNFIFIIYDKVTK